MENRNQIIALLIAVVVAAGVAILFFFNTSSENNLKNIDTETVTRGKVEAAFKCPGKVVSQNEVFILNPVRTVVKTIYKTAGSRVQKGDVILLLDDEKIRTEIGQLTNQLNQKKNLLDKNRLNAKSTKLDLEHAEQAKKIRIDRLKATLDQQEKMLEAGGISEQRVEQTKQDLVLAESDLNKQAEKNNLRLKQLNLDQQNIELQISSFKKSISEKNALLAKMKITAPVSGIITELNASVGERAEIDRVMVRISDDSALKILCRIAKNKMNQLQTGDEALVLTGGKELKATIGQIFLVEESVNGSFDVQLLADDQNKLDPGQNVEVLVNTNDTENVLRIAKLPGVKLEQQMDVLVLKEDEIIRTEIVLGVIGKNYCEVISGLEEGDKVLVANPSSFRK